MDKSPDQPKLMTFLLLREASLTRRIVECSALAILEVLGQAFIMAHSGFYFPSIAIVMVVFIALIGGRNLGLIYGIAISLVNDYFFIPPIGGVLENREAQEHFVIVGGLAVASVYFFSFLRSAFVATEWAKNEAERANRTRDIFLATLSHELRTPVAGILTWAELLQNVNFEPRKIKCGLEIIEHSAKRQSQLIDV